MAVSYRMVESVLKVTTSVTHQSNHDASPTEVNRSVELALGTSVASHESTMDLDSFGSDDWSVSLTIDGHLQSVSYKSVGVGGQIVKGAGKLLAFVGGISLATLGRAPAEAKAGTSPRERWAAANPLEDQLLRAATAQTRSATVEMTKMRSAILEEADFAKQRELALRLRRLRVLRAEASVEAKRLGALFDAWKARSYPKRTKSDQFEIRLSDVPVATFGAQLDTASLSPSLAKLWDEFGIAAQLEPISSSEPPHSPWHDPAFSTDPDKEHKRIRWRVPRRVRLTVWRKDDAERAYLSSATVEYVVDDRSSTATMPIDSKIFGDESATVEFGTLGEPTKLSQGDTSGAAAFADALAALPDSVNAGLTAAKGTIDGVSDLRSSTNARRLQALKTELELKQQALENEAFAATEADYVEIKQLEQQVTRATLGGQLGATETAELTARLTMADTELKLDALRIDAELAGVRAEIERLTAAADLAKLTDS